MAKLPQIAPELADLPHVPLDSLEELQGDFKDLNQREYEKLKQSITEFGLIVPFFVWKETGKLIDGHQRRRVMLKEGWLMDVPVVYIAADNEQDAKMKLLVVSSQYGRVSQESWDAFTWDLPDAAEWSHFDALPFVFNEYSFGPGDDPNEHWQGMPEYEHENLAPWKTLKVHFENKETYQEFIELIQQKMTEDTISIWYPERPEKLTDQMVRGYAYES